MRRPRDRQIAAGSGARGGPDRRDRSGHARAVAASPHPARSGRAASSASLASAAPTGQTGPGARRRGFEPAAPGTSMCSLAIVCDTHYSAATWTSPRPSQAPTRSCGAAPSCSPACSCSADARLRLRPARSAAGPRASAWTRTRCTRSCGGLEGQGMLAERVEHPGCPAAEVLPDQPRRGASCRRAPRRVAAHGRLRPPARPRRPRMTTLTDRYVWAVLRAVPAAQRADLEPEIRALIADAIDAKAAAGDVAPDGRRTCRAHGARRPGGARRPLCRPDRVPHRPAGLPGMAPAPVAAPADRRAAS